jgi:Putative addiction module component
MARSLPEIQKAIQALSTADKEALLRSLWEDLDGVPAAEVDEAWLEEAKRRDKELDLDDSQSSPAADVFARLESSLRK